MVILDFENLKYFEFTKNNKSLPLSFKSKHMNFKCKFLSKLNEMHAMLRTHLLFYLANLGCYTQPPGAPGGGLGFLT